MTAVLESRMATVSPSQAVSPGVRTQLCSDEVKSLRGSFLQPHARTPVLDVKRAVFTDGPEAHHP